MSKIEWTEKTWNPLAGCSRASEGCDHCYAAAMSLRLEGMAQKDIAEGKAPGRKAKYIGVATRNGKGTAVFNGRINLDEEALTEPLRWKKPRLVFVNSMSDLFHRDVPFEFTMKVFETMARAGQHTFQVLTKRPDHAVLFLKWYDMKRRELGFGGDLLERFAYLFPNIWFGTSVENQAAADERIPHLLEIPAAVRFLSCEPLLNELYLNKWLLNEHGRRHIGARPGISWIVVGGESGPGARPMHPRWPRKLRDQCQAAGVPFFFKQWGNWFPAFDSTVSKCHTWPDGERAFNLGKKAAGRLLDGREWNEMPVSSY